MLHGSDACIPNSSSSEWDYHSCFLLRNCQPQCFCTNILNWTQLEYSADLFYPLQKRNQMALGVNVVFHCWGFDSSLDSNLERWLDGFNLSPRYPNQNFVWKGHTAINAQLLCIVYGATASFYDHRAVCSDSWIKYLIPPGSQDLQSDFESKLWALKKASNFWDQFLAESYIYQKVEARLRLK